MGVVFGHLGTSPLHALQDAFVGGYGIDPNRAKPLGVVSLFLWSLVLVVRIKYLAVMMRAPPAAFSAATQSRGRDWLAGRAAREFQRRLQRTSKVIVAHLDS